METDPFKKEYTGTRDGHREFSDSPRPNLKAIEKKRDQYLLEAVNKVLKGYDQNKIDILARSNFDINNPKVEAIMNDLILAIEAQLYRDHSVDIFGLSIQGELDSEDKKIVDAMAELERTYPKDLIGANIRALVETGYMK